MSFSTQAYNTYYDSELSLLTIQNPQLAIEKSNSLLKANELSGNYKNQLIALFYLAEAYSVLSDNDKVDNYANRGLLLAREQNDVIFISEFLGYQAYQADLKGLYREANKLANQALILSKETDSERLVATKYLLRSQIQLSLENYQNALDDVEKSIQAFTENNDRERLSISYNILALIYGGLDDLDNSIKFLQESIIYDDVKSPYNMSVYYYNMGLSLMEKGSYDDAIENLDKSMELAKSLNDESTLAFVEYGLAEVYIRQEKWVEAEEKALKSIAYFEKSDDLIMHFNINLLMVDIQSNNKNFATAQKYLDLAELQLDTLNTPNSQLIFISAKINMLAHEENWKEAYELSKERDRALQVMVEKEKEISLNEMKIRFDAQFDQDKLEFLQKENELQQQSIEQEQLKRFYLWALVGLSVIVFFLTYFAYRHQKNTKKHFFNLTRTDDLTGIPNRRFMINKLTKIHKSSKSNEFPLAVIMVDLDHFKKVNDTYGHAKGNDVLIHFAHSANDLIKDIGFVGRLGGEEWLIILPHHNVEDVQVVLQMLRHDYNQPQKLHLPREHNLSFSSGVLICKNKCLGMDDMLKTVDDSLYQAKDNGRNQDIYVLK